MYRSTTLGPLQCPAATPTIIQPGCRLDLQRHYPSTYNQYHKNNDGATDLYRGYPGWLFLKELDIKYVLTLCYAILSPIFHLPWTPVTCHKRCLTQCVSDLIPLHFQFEPHHTTALFNIATYTLQSAQFSICPSLLTSLTPTSATGSPVTRQQ